MNFESIIESIKNNHPLKTSIFDGSKNEWIKKHSNVKKGCIGEALVANVLKAEKSGEYEYDLVKDEKKIEVKLSCLNETLKYKWLNIRTRDSYTHLALVGIEPNNINLFLVPKDKVINLSPLAGGKRTESDITYLQSNRKVDWLEKYRISM